MIAKEKKKYFLTAFDGIFIANARRLRIFGAHNFVPLFSISRLKFLHLIFTIGFNTNTNTIRLYISTSKLTAIKDNSKILCSPHAIYDNENYEFRKHDEKLKKYIFFFFRHSTF